MTAARRTNNDDTVAATGFIAVLALAGGVIGLILAAAAVATERAWSGRRGTAPARHQLQQARAADYRAWLARDAADQAAWRQARRDWWEAGGDPATKPATPSTASRMGAGAYRAWARAAVFTGDFRNGWRDGWQAANQVRRGGGGFKDIVAARPGQERGTDDTSKNGKTPPDQTESTAYYRAVCGRCGWTGEPTTVHGDAADQQTAHRCRDGVKPPVADGIDENRLDREDAASEQPEPDTNNSEENTMGDTATTTGTAPQADSNAAVLAAHLDAINAGHQQISDLTDQMAVLRAVQEAKIRQADEFAESTGQSAQTRTALDAATTVAAQLGQHLGAFSDAAQQASEATSAARAGLTPVIHAADTLAQAGADGRAVAPATNA